MRPHDVDNALVENGAGEATGVAPDRALPEAELLRHAILNSSSFAVIATDAHGVIQLFNAGAERLLGYAAGEVLNKARPSDFHDPQEVTDRAAALSIEFATPIAPGFEALSFKASRDIEDKYELTYVCKDGMRLPGIVSTTALRDDRGMLIGYLLIGSDNTAHKLIEQAANFQHGDDLFRQFATNLPEALWIWEVGGKTLRYFNPGWEKMTGRAIASGEGTGKLLEAFHPDDRRWIAEESSGFAMGGADLDCRLMRPDGVVRWVRARTFPISDVEGHVVRIAGMLEDITTRKEETQRHERLKDEFVSTVSHELRTPLTSIAGALGLLIGNAAGKLPDPATRLLTIAHTNSKRLVRLIDDILDIEKIESGKVVFDLKRVEARSLVEQAIDAARGFAQVYDVRIRLDPASESDDVRADPDRLMQVVTNLLSNAVKFSPRGAEVVVKVESRPDAVHMSVRDHGTGIPDAFKPRIFEKFAQADNSDTRQKGGTGLGLSIVKQIVDRLEGTVSFEDAQGGGTIFHVDLPSWRYLASREIAIGGTGGGRILLCQSDHDAAMALRGRLAQIGCAVDFAYTARDARARAAAVHYAVMLVDLELPDGDGIGLILHLREQVQYRNTPIVVVSSDPSRGRNDPRSSTLNVLHWLAKPLDVERLVQVLDNPIALRATERPRILHVDDEQATLDMVGAAFGADADVVSVDTIEDARRALATDQFDLVILDVALHQGSGLDLLPDLRDIDDNPIPVVVFSVLAKNAASDAQVQDMVVKSQASIDELVAAVHDRLAHRRQRTAKEIA